jgi:hypothetical protein
MTAAVDERRLKTVSLKNGLAVDLVEASRKIAQDRWFVTLIARVHIPVEKKNSGTMDVDAMLQTLGPVVTFEKKMERNFISESEKESVLNRMVASMIALSDQYLGHPEFARKYLLKKFMEQKHQRAWYK